MVLHKQGEMLYRGVNQLVAENLDHLANSQVVPAFPSGASDGTMQSQEAEMLLKALRNIWDDHTSNMIRLGQILKYMVRPGPLRLNPCLFVSVGSCLCKGCRRA